MAGALTGIAVMTGIFYGIFVDGTWWLIYFSLLTVYYIITQVLMQGTYNFKLRRAITIASWDEPNNSACWVLQEYDCTNALKYIKKLRAEQDPEKPECKVTLTTLYALAVAKSMDYQRRAFGRIVWGNFRASKTMGVTVLVDKDGGKDLIPVTV